MHLSGKGENLRLRFDSSERTLPTVTARIGLDITFPKEGVAPGVQETADAVANLIALGYADQIVLSHDVFLKQMWAKNGGNGWGFVPNVFLAYLAARGVDNDTLRKLCIDNPARLLTA